MPAQAAAQGAAAADDAIVQLNALGLGVGQPGVLRHGGVLLHQRRLPGRDPHASSAQWTERLHARGYVSGHLLQLEHPDGDLVVDTQGDRSRSRSRTGRALVRALAGRQQDAPGDPTLSDPAIPDQYFADHQRIHQYRGGHQETWGGITVNIDNDSVDAPVAPSQLAAEGSLRAGQRTWHLPDRRRRTDRGERLGRGGRRPAGADAVARRQFDSLPNLPREGTFLQSGATGRIWRVVKGVATYVPSWTPYGGPQPSIVIDQAALDNAGTGGVWNHLASGRPAPRTTGPSTFGSTKAKERFTWFGGYSSSVVTRYDVRWRKARWDGTFGGWT